MIYKFSSTLSRQIEIEKVRAMFSFARKICRVFIFFFFKNSFATAFFDKGQTKAMDQSQNLKLNKLLDLLALKNQNTKLALTFLTAKLAAKFFLQVVF